jgi:hypothetical protein
VEISEANELQHVHLNNIITSLWESDVIPSSSVRFFSPKAVEIWFTVCSVLLSGCSLHIKCWW